MSAGPSRRRWGIGEHFIGNIDRASTGRSTGQAGRQLPRLLAWAALALVVGTAGSLLLAGWIRRQTLGLEPADITRQYQHHDAMLHAVREGLLITDRAGRLVLANDEAHRLIGVDQGRCGCATGRAARRSGAGPARSPDGRLLRMRIIRKRESRIRTI